MSMPGGTTDPAIVLSNVWKIFGERSEEALAAIETEQLDKAEVQSRFNCIVGVADASIEVARGEIFCVMGLSGSGKSTLVRHINRLLEPTSGRIEVEGQDVMAMGDDALRRLRAQTIGMVFQNFGLLPHRTVRDNVGLPLEVQSVPKLDRFDQAERCLDLVDLGDWGDSFAHELSGGMQQRVGLARALAADPDILLMDEPFSALDPLIRRQLQAEFMALSKELHKTTVFITHDLDEAIRIGDRIAIMKDGRIVQTGTPEEIVTDPADDYVADFVSGISRLKLVHAAKIMRPLPTPGETGMDLTSAPRAPVGADLDSLVDLVLSQREDIVIVDESGAEVGLVTQTDLLRGVQGGKEQPVEVETQSAAAFEVGAATSRKEQNALIAEFVGRGAGHYIPAFRRIGEGRWGVINLGAVVFGPIWAGARSLWSVFWAFVILELIGLVQIGRGFLGDLGSEAAARAASLLARADARAERAADAAASGADNAARLAASADRLRDIAASAQTEADALSAQSTQVALIGLGIFVVVKLIEALTADRALEWRFTHWRSDRSIRSGLSWVGAAIATLLVAFIYPVTIYRFSAAEPPAWLTTFPADNAIRASAARWIDHAFDWLAIAGEGFFDSVTAVVRALLDTLELMLVATPWPVVMVAICAIAWLLAGARVAIFTAVALAYLALFGFWEKSMATVALLGAAAVICVVIGVPLGIWFAKSDRAYAAARPVLDFMQTMPAFVYLIPVIAFFGTGKPPGILATLVFGMPPVIRLTALGMKGVPYDVTEAASAFGATRTFRLWKVELPLAMPSIKTGINQTILMCLSMVVIASLIGAKGLGEDVLEALQYAAEGQGMLAGLAILFCAMALDRIVAGRAPAKSA
ncbi:betaine/proline/choline family ABC transporter ATP-binding protein [Afifella marina]|uniref:Quaternary amine transport ATP-binding protein n=1 Tax=Afifella marina DSM 2698 TaxID=1120955 RepID=A0A1G5NH73_AFIMA|nr:glycine betaine/L-proline transport ATP binding subunit [Afifella marina DSM 2698]